MSALVQRAEKAEDLETCEVRSDLKLHGALAVNGVACMLMQPVRSVASGKANSKLGLKPRPLDRAIRPIIPARFEAGNVRLVVICKR